MCSLFLSSLLIATSSSSSSSLLPSILPQPGSSLSSIGIRVMVLLTSLHLCSMATSSKFYMTSSPRSPAPPPTVSSSRPSISTIIAHHRPLADWLHPIQPTTATTPYQLPLTSPSSLSATNNSLHQSPPCCPIRSLPSSTSYHYQPASPYNTPPFQPLLRRSATTHLQSLLHPPSTLLQTTLLSSSRTLVAYNCHPAPQLARHPASSSYSCTHLSLSPPNCSRFTTTTPISSLAALLPAPAIPSPPCTTRTSV